MSAARTRALRREEGEKERKSLEERSTGAGGSREVGLVGGGGGDRCRDGDAGDGSGS